MKFGFLLGRRTKGQVYQKMFPNMKNGDWSIMIAAAQAVVIEKDQPK